MLNVVGFQRGSGTPIVFVHGFTQRAEVWRSTAEALDLRNPIYAVDLPGHGDTSPGFDSANVRESATLLTETIGEPAIYLGYSLGARVLLEAMPGAIGVVLIGAKLKPDDPTQRRADDERLAESIATDGIDLFIDLWMKHPFNARIPEAQQYIDLRKSNRPDGLAASLRHAGSAEQPTTAASLEGVETPTLLIQGDTDLHAVMATNSRLQSALSNSRIETVLNCGHSVPFERPADFKVLVEDFVRQLTP